MHYYSHNIGDFDRTTRHLSRLERSIYRDLIDLYFDTEQALTLDVSALCRRIVARSEEEKSAVLGVLDEFFVETEAGWSHEACDEQIASYRKKAVLARENGKTGGRPKKPTDNPVVTDKKPTETEIGSSQVMESEPTGNPEQTHEKANQEPRTNNQDKTPHTPQGGIVEAAKRTRASRGCALKTFLADCKTKNERPIRDYEPLWNYTRTAGLPDDFVALAWVEFCRRFGAGGVKETKVQIDWRKTFRNYVEGNFLKLWAHGPDGYFLTTQGHQAQRVAEAA